MNLTRGTPRSINLLGHAALVYGFAGDIPVIDVPIIEVIVTDTQETEIGNERWFLEKNEEATGEKVTEMAAQTPTPQPQHKNDLEG